jgi:hypothetical protein
VSRNGNLSLLVDTLLRSIYTNSFFPRFSVSHDIARHGNHNISSNLVATRSGTKICRFRVNRPLPNFPAPGVRRGGRKAVRARAAAAVQRRSLCSGSAATSAAQPAAGRWTWQVGRAGWRWCRRRPRRPGSWRPRANVMILKYFLNKNWRYYCHFMLKIQLVYAKITFCSYVCNYHLQLVFSFLMKCCLLFSDKTLSKHFIGRNGNALCKSHLRPAFHRWYWSCGSCNQIPQSGRFL